MKYKNFTTEDFVLDSEFRKWVHFPDRETNARWQAFLKQHPEKQTAIIKAQQLISTLPVNYDALSDNEYQDIIDGIETRINTSDKIVTSEKIVPLNPYTVSRQPTYNHTRGLYLRYAAAITLIALTGIWLFIHFDSDRNKIQNTTTPQHHNTIVKQNPAGQKSQFRLPDGTKIWLNAESQLTYSEDFSETNRNITLTGEAFFDVVKDEHHPFTITSRDLTTTVLGTAFNITAYENEDIKVSVEIGKVKVEKAGSRKTEDGRKNYRHSGRSDSDDPESPSYRTQEEDNSKSSSDFTLRTSVYLTPNQQAVYSDNTKGIITKTVNLTTALAWKQNILLFTNANFETVKKQLERWYGVSIQTNKTPLNWQYNGSFDNESLERVLERMGLSERFTYEIENKHVDITF